MLILSGFYFLDSDVYIKYEKIRPGMTHITVNVNKDDTA